jgi:threonine/homoserine/homoserine lactone efflux protein
MGWIDAELALTALAAMLSPTTLTFSVLVLVLGDAAADQTPGSPKTPVAIFDVVAGALLIAFVIRMLRRPPNPKRAASMFDQMQKVASSPAVAIVGAGAALANPGAFIPIALKSISELDPSTTEYIVNWVFFTVVSLLPLAVALVLLLVARDWAERLLEGVRRWLDKNARTIAAVIIVALAASLIRNGIAGLTS